MLETMPANDILLNTDIVRLAEHPTDMVRKGSKVTVITAFYGGRQKGIVVDGPFFDRLLHNTFYDVRITSRRPIYGGAQCGEIVSGRYGVTMSLR